MRSLWSLACLAACTFGAPKIEPAVGVDAQSGADAVVAADAAEPTWVRVDEFSVPVNGATVMSTFVLQAGVRYRLRASGTFIIQSPQGTPADAEYWVFDPPTDGVPGVDVGLAVDDPSVDENRTPKWGPYNPTHVYEVDWVGGNAPIRAQLHDGNFDNNTGVLKLEILAFQ